MSTKFGWAYVDCGLLLSASGPTGSVQFRVTDNSDGTTAISGSRHFMFFTQSNAVGVGLDGDDKPNDGFALQVNGNTAITGNLDVSGTIKSYKFETITVSNTTYEGDTRFGNSPDDTHRITGSLLIGGNKGAYITGSQTGYHGVQIVGNLSGSGKAIFASNLITARNLYVSGNTHLGNATTDWVMITGSVGMSGSVFEIESPTAGENQPEFRLTNLHADNQDAHINFRKFSPSPADADLIGHIDFYGRDDAMNTHEFANIYTQAVKVANGSERGSLVLSVTDASSAPAGDVTQYLSLDGNRRAVVVGPNSTMLQVSGNAGISGSLYVWGETKISGNVGLGNAATDIITVNGQLTASEGIKATKTSYFTQPVQITTAKSLSFNGATNTAKITNNGTNLDINSPGNIVLNAGNPNNVSSSARFIAAELLITGEGAHNGDLTVSGSTTLGNATSDYTMVTGSFKISGNVFELNSAASSGASLYVINHNADANSGQIFIQKKSDSPADDDYVGKLGYVGQLNTKAAYEYGNIETQAISVANKVGLVTLTVSDDRGGGEVGAGNLMPYLSLDGKRRSVTVGPNGVMLQVSGNAGVSGSLYVWGETKISGNVGLGNAAADIVQVNGRLTASQGLYADGKVGIGIVPDPKNTYHFRLIGNMSGSGGAVFGNAVTTEGALNVSGNAAFNSNVNVGGNLEVKGMTTLGDGTGDYTQITGSLYMGGNKGAYLTGSQDGYHGIQVVGSLSGSGRAIFERDLTTGGALNVSGTIHGGSDAAHNTADHLRLGGLTNLYKIGRNADGLLQFQGTQAGATGYTFLNDDDSVDFVILDNGNVGVNVASPTHQLTVGGDLSGSGRAIFERDLTTGGALNVSGNTQLGHSSEHVVTSTARLTASAGVKADNTSYFKGIVPLADNTWDLGSAASRWANIYTGDLHLKNERGDWTVIEEESYLTVRNNKTGKRFKLLMEEIED